MYKAFTFVKHFQSANSIYLVSTLSDQINVIPFPSLLLNSVSESVRKPERIRHSLCPHVAASRAAMGEAKTHLGALQQPAGLEGAGIHSTRHPPLLFCGGFCFVFHQGPNSPFLTLAISFISTEDS